MANYELEKELMSELRELTELEQNEISVMIAMYSNNCNQYKQEKQEDFLKSLENQIQFYGRKRAEYDLKINEILEKYMNFIDKVIIRYNTRFMALLNEINNTEMNQKTSIVNQKISIDRKDQYKIEVTDNQKNNYEIVLQECFRQAEECWNECEKSLNDIFYTRNNQLSVKKTGFFHKLINLFNGKKNIDKFVFEALETEFLQLENKVNSTIQAIEGKTLDNIVVIKDAQAQTKSIFEEMLRG